MSNVLDLDGMDPSATMRGVQYQNRGFFFNGRNRMRKFDGVDWNLAGITADPFLKPTVTEGDPDPASYLVTQATVATNIATLTSAGHPFVNGQSVTINLDAPFDYYNGVYDVTVPGVGGVNTFDYALTHGDAGPDSVTGKAYDTAALQVGLSGRYRYYIAPVNTLNFNKNGQPVMGVPSDFSDEITVLAHKIVVGNIPATHEDPQVTGWYVWRNKSGIFDSGVAEVDQDFFFVGFVPIGETQFIDDTIDDKLSDQDRLRFNLQIPPTFQFGAIFGERMFGAGFKPFAIGAADKNSGDGTLIDFSVDVPDGVVGCWFQAAGDPRRYTIIKQTAPKQVQLESEFIGGLLDSAYRIYNEPWDIFFSEYEDMEAWGPAGAVFRNKVSVPGHQPVTVLIAYQGNLLAFTPWHIYAIVGKGPDLLDVQIFPDPLYSGLGCVSPDAICLIDNEVYFLTLRGPAVLRGGGAPELIGGPLRRDWLDSLSNDELLMACAGSDGRHVWFSVPVHGGAGNSKTFRFDRVTQSWFEETGAYPRQFVQEEGDDGVSVTSFTQGRFLVRPDYGDLDFSGGTYQGAALSHTTTSLTAFGSFPADALEEATVFLFEDGIFKAARRITSASGSTFNWTAAVAFGAGAVTFEIGNIWWKLRSRLVEVPGHASKNFALHVSLDNPAGGRYVDKTDFVDGIQGAKISIPFFAGGHPIGQKKFECSVRDRDYSALFESRTGAAMRQVMLELSVREADK